MNESAAQQNQSLSLAEDTPVSTRASGTATDQVPDGQESEEGLLPTSEDATLAGVDSRTIRRWFAAGKIRGKLDGHKLLVYADKIEKLSGTTPGTDDDFSPPDPGQQADMSGAEILDVDVSGTDRDALIEKMMNQLVGAAGRVSWLECELEQQRKELRLLPDLQARASELDQAKAENEALKKHIVEIELLLARERNTFWNRFRTWFQGRDQGTPDVP